MKTFSNEKIKLQYSVLSYQIDLYFTGHKLAVEIDEKGQTDRLNFKEERENKIKEKIKCKFIRINPDKEEIIIFIEIGKIQDYIDKSTKKLTKIKLKNQQQNL